MTPAIRQWDVIRVRVRPDDRDEHPAVVGTCDEFCASEQRLALNVLYCSTRRPGIPPDPYEVVLNGADGLERPTVFNCGHLYTIDRRKISATLGRVAPERRRQIGRKIVATYRLPLWSVACRFVSHAPLYPALSCQHRPRARARPRPRHLRPGRQQPRMG